MKSSSKLHDSSTANEDTKFVPDRDTKEATDEKELAKLELEEAV